MSSARSPFQQASEGRGSDQVFSGTDGIAILGMAGSQHSHLVQQPWQFTLVSPMCTTTHTAAAKSAGNAAVKDRTASTRPADAPSTTSEVVFSTAQQAAGCRVIATAVVRNGPFGGMKNRAARVQSGARGCPRNALRRSPPRLDPRGGHEAASPPPSRRSRAR